MSEYRILEICARAFDVKPADIKSKRRQRKITNARKAYSYACWTFGITQVDIAATLNCNRSYISYAVRSVRDWKDNPSYTTEASRLANALRNIVQS